MNLLWLRKGSFRSIFSGACHCAVQIENPENDNENSLVDLNRVNLLIKSV